MTSIDPTAPEDSPGVDPEQTAGPDQQPEVTEPTATQPDATEAGATEPEAAIAGPAEPALPVTPEQQRFDLLRQKAEASLALLDAQAARVSSLSGGTRFSTLQKTQYGFGAELRALRAQPATEATIQAVESLTERADRLVASLSPAGRGMKIVSGQVVPDGTPPDDAAADGSSPATFANTGALRQALIRGMILLAPAPLHLQIEFAPDFPLAEGDALALAARSHAINRAALGSLRRIQWEAPGRASLWFGEGGQRRIATATFDEQHKVALPPEFRQKQNPPGQGASRKPAAAPKPPMQQPVRVELMGPPRPPRPRVELVGPPRPRVELMGPPSPFARPKQGARRGSGGQAGAPAGVSRPEAQRRGPRSGSGGRPNGRTGQATQPAGGTQPGRAPWTPGSPQGSPENQRQDPRRQGESRRPQRPGGSRDGGGPQRAPVERQRSGEPRAPAGPGVSRGPGSPTGTDGGRRDDRPSGARRDRDDRRERDDRSARQGPRGGGGGFPANSTLADKLRAALTPKAASREASPAAGEVPPSVSGDASSPKKD